MTWKAPSDVEEITRPIRVHGWNAAELKQAEGPAMRDRFAELLTAAKAIDLHPVARSFERIVCDVYIDGVLFAGLLGTHLDALRHDQRRFMEMRPPV